MGKSESTVRQTARKYDFRMAKKFGQNFLTDSSAIEAIADASGAGPNDLVFEIGPGFGVLTRPLAERAGRLVAIEIDKKLIPILESELKDLKNVSVINEDVLKVDFDELISKYSYILCESDAAREEYSSETDGTEACSRSEQTRSEDKTERADSVNPEPTYSEVKTKKEGGVKAKRIRIVGNLPYYITTPILLGLLEQKVPAETITVMVQKEVADRIVSPPGGKDYGVLSVSLQYYCECSFVLDVPRESFMPSPNVDSAVVNLTLRKEKVQVKSEEMFFKLVKKAFSQRRKTLCNSITGLEGHTKEEIAEIMERCGIESSRRAETLSIEEFARLADAFVKD